MVVQVRFNLQVICDRLCLSLGMSSTITLTLGQNSDEIFKLMIWNVLSPNSPRGVLYQLVKIVYF